MAAIRLIIRDSTKKKLAEKHQVSVEEVEQCFYNREGLLSEDTREEHKSDPPTPWFVSKTDRGGKLAVFLIVDDCSVIIKSAFEPSESRVKLYKKLCGS